MDLCKKALKRHSFLDAEGEEGIGWRPFGFSWELRCLTIIWFGVVEVFEYFAYHKIRKI